MATWGRKTESVEQTSPDIITEQIDRLKDLFPEVVSEGKVDFEMLKTMLGEIVEDRTERYSFTWAGKRDAIRLLQIPSRATLKPCPEESVDWETTENVFIEGENLEVLKLLYKSYAGRVKLIYIDPPYNTGTRREFIYSDDFTDPLETYLKFTSQTDNEGNLLTSNPETSGRYHSAWLSMMYPRLFVARQLLRDDGVIFVSIDDHELHNLRCLMNEIFGEENFIATIIWQKVFSPKNTAKHFSEDHDYIVVYARNAEVWQPELLPRTEEADSRYTNPDDDPRDVWSSSDLTARNYYSEGEYEVKGPSGKIFRPPKGRYWIIKKQKFLELDADGRIWWGEKGDNMPRLKRFLSEVKQGIVPQTLWSYEEVGHTQEAKKELIEYVEFENTENVLDTLKPTRLIQRILQVASEESSNDIVLDFFSGSAPTAHAVFKQNHEDNGTRNFILVQLPEPLPRPEAKLRTIADIGKERLYQVISKIQNEDGAQQTLINDHELPEDLGFRVFKLGESNYRQWEGVGEKDSEAYAEQMSLFTDLLKPGWVPEDVIWEVALKEGYSLSSLIENLSEITGNQVWQITDPNRGQSFYICLDDVLKEETIQAMRLNKEDFFVCRDAALTDEMAVNLALQCKLKIL